MRDLMRTCSAYAALAFFHVVAVSGIALGSAAVFADLRFIVEFAGALEAGIFEPSWSVVGFHVALSAVVWFCGVAGFQFVRERFREDDELHRVAAPERGAVVTETVIVMPFLLLMISGLTQLAMINIASIVADLAAFQGARTASLWDQEAKMGRAGDVEDRAKTAVAIALAPTASADFAGGDSFGGDPGVDSFKRARAAIAASFADGTRRGDTEYGMENYMSGGANMDTGPDNLSFTRAFDSMSFRRRAGRKMTAAWQSLDDFTVKRKSGEIGVEFVYEYRLLLPWFGYVFTDSNVEGGDKWVTRMRRHYRYPQHTAL